MIVAIYITIKTSIKKNETMYQQLRNADVLTLYEYAIIVIFLRIMKKKNASLI